MIRINPDILVENFLIAKEYLETKGVKASVMQKDFYASLCLDKALKGLYHQLWTGKVRKGMNYLIDSIHNPIYFSGGILASMEDIILTRDKVSMHKSKFKGYIPMDWADGREGLAFSDVLTLLKAANTMETEYFKCSNVMLTMGCLHGNVPKLGKLFELCDELARNGCTGVSIGGSYALQYQNFHPLIEEVRLGEFILYGTIPFKFADSLNGKSAVEMYLKILQVHKGRQEVLLKGGSCFFDGKNSTVVSNGFEFVQQSTEYTILKYDSLQSPNVGELIEFIPDYHSLIKILK